MPGGPRPGSSRIAASYRIAAPAAPDRRSWSSRARSAPRAAWNPTRTLRKAVASPGSMERVIAATPGSVLDTAHGGPSSARSRACSHSATNASPRPSTASTWRTPENSSGPSAPMTGTHCTRTPLRTRTPSAAASPSPACSQLAVLRRLAAQRTRCMGAIMFSPKRLLRTCSHLTASPGGRALGAARQASPGGRAPMKGATAARAALIPRNDPRVFSSSS